MCISPVVFTVVGLNVIDIPVKAAGSKFTAEKESFAEISFPISMMKGDVVTAGVGFVIPDRPMAISEIA